MAVNTDRIQEWMKAREAVRQWTEHERKLREEVCLEVFEYNHTAGNVDGTKHFDLGNGWDLKGVFGKTYTVKAGAELDLAVTAMRDAPVAAPKPVLVWKPAISTSGWNVAPDQIRKILSPVVTMKPTAPQLTVEHKK